MDAHTYIHINFIGVKWPRFSLPSNFSKDIRGEFLLSRDGNLFSKEDLKDILTAWLYDEFNVCPLDFDFELAAES